MRVATEASGRFYFSLNGVARSFYGAKSYKVIRAARHQNNAGRYRIRISVIHCRAEQSLMALVRVMADW